MKRFLLAWALAFCITACGTMQSLVKTSFPYTATLTIPAGTQVGENHAAIALATSFDKNFFKKANKINAIKITAAELHSSTPADFDLGNLKSVKVYLCNGDESEAILVASKENVTVESGNVLTLMADNSNFLDKYIREPDMKIKMIYQLNKKITTETNIMAVLNISAAPVGGK